MWRFLVAVGIAMALLAINKPRVIAITPSAQLNMPPTGQISATSTNVWASYPLLKHIASCESWGDPNKEPRQFLSDGSVLRGYPNPNDIGMAQINAPTWEAKAKSLGFDIYTYQGNLGMAKWIFDHYGSQPWNWSRGCWGKYAN